MKDNKYYIINKPYGYLSQFTKEVPDHKVLGDLFPFPKDVYAVGRLDRDSEGLLILTNDKSLNQKLLHPKNKHQRTYYIQVEGCPTEEDLKKFNSPIEIKINKKIFLTAPCLATLLKETPAFEQRTPPIRYRENKPTTWCSITLTEGKNRQVRKMFAHIGFPVLRLVRYAIENLKLENMSLGEVIEIDRNNILNKLFYK